MKIERFLCNGELKSIQVENNPRFSWRIAGKSSQTAYQLVIYKGLNCVYDSGIIQGKVKNHTANFSLEELTEYTANLTVYSNTRLTTEKLVFRTALTALRYIMWEISETSTSTMSVITFKMD